ncbi:hypothetical protein LFL96_36845 (plasmid) [Paraburkholderia sp. D15]|uniref:hypothetical protein n=1 Tax=Paraburkholderia sp. D15 TaxID=2880218 RepID=UPI00247A6010|nr:hypothetical protein [Paraburkholderia sp. D15]WGS55047.1 hypothetical protein LFL96_36845 [Paraburkholderia sp. D15]
MKQATILRERLNHAFNALATYDFGQGVSLTGTDSTWKRSSWGDEWTTPVRVEVRDRSVAADRVTALTTSLMLVLRFERGSSALRAVFAVDIGGHIWGSMAAHGPVNAAYLLTEAQEFAMRDKLMDVGVSTFQRDSDRAGPQPGLKWHFSGCGQTSYDSETEAFYAACQLLGVTPANALRRMIGQHASTLPDSRAADGDWSHLFGRGRAEPLCGSALVEFVPWMPGTFADREAAATDR